MKLLPWAILVAFSLCGALTAAEFRQIDPITTPTRTRTLLPEGALIDCHPPACSEAFPVQQILPINAQTVSAAADRIAEVWNSGALDAFISDRFYDKWRLLDTIREVVPPDAELTVSSVRRINTIAQYLQWDGLSGSWLRFSIVNARIETELEFNDPERGFQDVEGEGDVLLLITERIMAL